MSINATSKPIMIKRIKVQNFLSLSNVDLELRARNVLIGANMSGKTNLIECLRFLQDAAARPTSNDTTGVQEAFAKRGGFDEVLWRGRSDGRIGIVLEIDRLGFAPEWATAEIYDLSFRVNEYDAPEIESEHLTITGSGKSTSLIENAAGKLKISDLTNSVNGPQNKLGLAIEPYGHGASAAASDLLKFIRSWRFYHLVPALMRASNPPGWEKYLCEHGENLSAWLLVLQNHPEEFRRLKQACCDVLPSLSEILFQPVEAAKAPPTTAG